MGRYIARRLLLTIPVLIGASFLIFALVYALPGDPIRALGGERPLSPAVVAQLREEFNLDDPLVIQYAKYVGDLLQGDLGTDFRGREVSETITQRLPVTLRLTAVAIAIETVIGIIAGVLAGIRRNGFLDNLVLVSSTLIVSVPILVLAFIAQFVLGLQFGWFPIAGINEGWLSYVLPGLVLASGSLAYVARLTRTSIAENLRADYVRTARAKGLPNRTVIGLVAGVLAGIRRNSFFDNLVLVSSTLVVSIPILVLAFVSQYLFGLRLGWFPIAGTNDGLYSYILPGLVLASGSLAYVARLTRTSIAENLRADYVRTARAKGLPGRTVVVRHTLRNSLIPVITFIGAYIGALMGGAIVTESVFNLPGIGREVYDAVRAQEGAVVVGIVTLMVFFFIFFNLVVDVLYAVLDPRIRYD